MASCALCQTPLPGPASRCPACPPGVFLPAGTRLAGGGVEVLGVLGWGDASLVYRARQVALDRPVALKELFPVGAERGAGLDVTGAGPEVAGFLGAARAMLGCRHPAIVGCFDAFEQHGTAYQVLELLEGPTLASLAPLPRARVAALARPLLAGLAALAAQGQSHGDVRPEHVLLDPRRGPTWIGLGAAARGLVSDPAASRPYKPTEACDAYAADLFGFAQLLRRASAGGASGPVRRALAQPHAEAATQAARLLAACQAPHGARELLCLAGALGYRVALGGLARLERPVLALGRWVGEPFEVTLAGIAADSRKVWARKRAAILLLGATLVPLVLGQQTLPGSHAETLHPLAPWAAGLVLFFGLRWLLERPLFDYFPRRGKR